ncbi:hypothetical protein TcasGA2_TC001399 [Tribolium castaneum]|uniref:Uncharacterized protein n=1 Tax=Tribolium castaneum TaxID=7070 RepID=D7EK99_TRICA|nr:hypothetical protein TcasGA2_TC001399 [Tribolium castaneum]
MNIVTCVCRLVNTLEMQVMTLVSMPYEGIQTKTLFIDWTKGCDQLVVWIFYQGNLVGPEVRKREFGGEDHERTIKLKFDARRHGPCEDIKHYYFDLVPLSNEVNPNVSFDMFRDKFEARITHLLRPRVQYQKYDMS